MGLNATFNLKLQLSQLKSGFSCLFVKLAREKKIGDLKS